jgi:hypothetical protein
MSHDPDRAPSGRLPRRATDRVEDTVAWALIAAALLLIVIAGVTGLGVHGRVTERAELENRLTSRASAVLLEDAQVVTGAGGVSVPAQVEARWTDRNGREHSGLLVADRSEPAGAAVDVWIDARGEITSPPVQPDYALAAAVAAAVGVVCAGGSLLIASWFGVRFLTGLVNARRWEQEWARVEPQWRRNIR